MKTATVVMALTLLSSLSMVQGCSPSEPMGESKLTLVQAQTLDPDAGKEKVTAPNPVAGRVVQKAIAMSAPVSNQQPSKGITMLTGSN